jgi:FMN phosphatase YigB (HAD superfamily)
MVYMDEVGLGRQLQKARQAAGLTQQELLAKIERGAIKSPSIFTIQSIAAALGTDLNDLMGEIAPKMPAATPKKRSKSGVRFVYFDINGCLVRFFHRAFTQLAEESGKSSDLIETTFWHYNDAVCRGEMSMAEFNQQFAGRLEMDSLDWSQYYLSAVDPIAEMQELVAWAAQHYHIGLLSNIMPGLIDEMRRNQILPPVNYSVIIDSSVVKAIKPEVEIFEIAQAKAGVPASEILLIDDARANIMAAERLGWHVLWFDDYRPDESVKRVRTALEPEE